MKKVLIFTCHGGGGHISAAKAIESYLSDYQTITVDAIGEVLVFLDPIYYISFTRYNGQDVYNILLRYNKKRIINILYHVGTVLISLQKFLIRKILLQCIQHHKPDIIISVIPMVNDSIMQAAQLCNIPCIVIPTDFDIHTFIKDLHSIPDQKFCLGLSFDYPEITSKLHEEEIRSEHVKIIGFPIRKNFFQKKNSTAIKSFLNIPNNKSIILLVMGANGSITTLEYLNALTTINFPFHCIICIGRNIQLEQQINSMNLPQQMSITILDGTADISDAMAVADICITKPGSVTFAETLYMNLPMLLDNTSPALIWEKFNLTFVVDHGLGNIINTYDDIAIMATEYLTNAALRNAIKYNISALKKKHFGFELNNVITELDLKK